MNKRFAVFDIDGTLIRWQLYHAIVDELAIQGFLGEKAKSQLHEARMIWKNRRYINAFKDYESELIKIYEKALGKIDPKSFDELVDRIIEEYKDQVNTYTRDLLQDLRTKGYFIIAISGSHHELIEKLGRYYNFDDWEGTKYERLAGKFSGEKYVASLNKAKVLNKMIIKHSLSVQDSYGIGDSPGDISILEMVENPIAFNPDKELFDNATEQGWPIVIERKNVIYKLQRVNNKYVLAT